MDDGLVDRIYEASVVPSFWPEVLRTFAEVAESRHAVVIATGDQKYNWVGSSPLMEATTKETYKYPGGHERTRRLLAADPAGFISDLDVFTESEILAEPLYTEYLIPNGLGRGLATVLHVPTGETIVFHAEGDYRLGPPGAALRHYLDGLRPHLARSSLVSAVATLAGLGLAACAVDGRGRVIVANSDFDEAGRHWTTRFADRIALIDRRADRLLAEALAVLELAHGPKSIPLRAEDGTPAVLHVVPTRRSALDLFARSIAILILTTASKTPSNATPLLQALFDLTAAEAGVAARVAAGQTLDDIAAADGKSALTLRNQLRSVMQKTGCRRQVDLVRLLTQLMPGRLEAAPSGAPA